MLSYRHAFHAGNHADVLKHIVLIECMKLLSRKEKGFLVVDTHAGAGAYTLTAGYAAQNEEWASGIARLRDKRDEDMPEIVNSYLKRVDEFASEQKDGYPGSPALITRLLRAQDRAVFCELHTTDHQTLDNLLGFEKGVRIQYANGFAALKALLPPPSRRGIMFIDPSYELAEDYERLIDTLRDSLKRFADGVYIVWYPLLERDEAKDLPARFAELGAKSTINATLRMKDAESGEWGMHGSGLFIINPPWTLEKSLREALPYLGRIFGSTADTSWTLEARETPHN
ncbi:MAG: 23S rRNA (adenine(2030)-N(6))-methyltransferase RlmJ [Treponemataceae bacterium]